MCRLGWVAIHHIPRVEAAVAGVQAGRQAGGLLLPPQGSQGCSPVINSESCLAPAVPHYRLCAQGCRTKGGPGTLMTSLFLWNCCPKGSPSGHSLLDVAILACLLHGLLLAALSVAGRWHLCWDREATHTMARLGSIGEGLGLSPTTTQRMSPYSS